MEAAIRQHQDWLASQPTGRGTGDYYSYCEEGSSGMMVWIDLDPADCYGWFYEYLDGNRIAKVNTVKLKAEQSPGVDLTVIKEWCDNNGFWCTIVSAAIPYVGKYLKRLI